MPSTRYAPAGAPLQQHRFASSPEFKRGLSAHLVSKRTDLLKDPDAVALIWSLQAESHQPGGLEAVARDVLEGWPERKPTLKDFDYWELIEECYSDISPEFRQLQRDLRAATTQEVRAEILEDSNQLGMALDKDPRIRKHPSLRPFFEMGITDTSLAAILASELNLLPEKLARFCLDPAIPVADGWPYCFPKLYSTLQERRARQAAAATAAVTHTGLSRAVWRELDTALSAGGLSLLTAPAGTGLSHAAKTWLAAHPGHAIYFDVPAGNDLTSYFRALAHSLGDAEGLSHKAVQLKERATHVLETRQRVLIVDKAKNLFPSNGYRYGFPERLEWLLSDVLSRGVSVVLLADESLWTWLGFIEKRTGWDRSALVSQARVPTLPSNLTLPEVEAVTRAMLPGAEAAAARALAQLAFLPPPLSFHRLYACARLARDRAGQQGRERITLADVQELFPDCQASARALSAGLTQANEARDRRSPRPGRKPLDNGRRRNLIVGSADVSARALPGDKISRVAEDPQPECNRAAAALQRSCLVELVPG